MAQVPVCCLTILLLLASPQMSLLAIASLIVSGLNITALTFSLLLLSLAHYLTVSTLIAYSLTAYSLAVLTVSLYPDCFVLDRKRTNASCRLRCLIMSAVLYFWLSQQERASETCGTLSQTSQYKMPNPRYVSNSIYS